MKGKHKTNNHSNPKINKNRKNKNNFLTEKTKSLFFLKNKKII